MIYFGDKIIKKIIICYLQIKLNIV